MVQRHYELYATPSKAAVNPITPCLEATYKPIPGAQSNPPSEAVLFSNLLKLFLNYPSYFYSTINIFELRILEYKNTFYFYPILSFYAFLTKKYKKR